MQKIFTLIFALICSFSFADNCAQFLNLHQDGTYISSMYTSMIFTKKSELIKTVYKAPNDSERSVLIYGGVPKFVKLIKPKEYEKFRIYFEEKSQMETVLKTGSVLSSIQPYVRFNPDKEIYIDLTGVFLTKADISAEMVGLSPAANKNFIDLTIDPNIQIFEIEKKRIYLIPLPKRNPQWVIDAYSKYVQTGVVDIQNEHVLRSLEGKQVNAIRYYIPITLIQQ